MNPKALTPRAKPVASCGSRRGTTRGLEDFHRAPTAPDEQAPRTDVTDDFDDPVLPVEKSRVNRESHEESVDRVALEDQHPLVLRQGPRPDQTLRPLRKRAGDLRAIAEDLNRVHHQNCQLPV